MKLSRGYLALIIILAVIILDQVAKIWIKTHFYLGESYEVTSWFRYTLLRTTVWHSDGNWAAS